MHATTHSIIHARQEYGRPPSVLRRVLILAVLINFMPIHTLSVAPSSAAEMKNQEKPGTVALAVDFSGYPGGPVRSWLGAKGFKFEKDARDHRLLKLSIANDVLSLKAKGHLRGFLINDGVDLQKVSTIRITWGIIRYPREVSYARRINNEALMVYIFFGRER